MKQEQDNYCYLFTLLILSCLSLASTNKSTKATLKTLHTTLFTKLICFFHCIWTCKIGMKVVSHPRDTYKIGTAMLCCLHYSHETAWVRPVLPNLFRLAAPYRKNKICGIQWRAHSNFFFYLQDHNGMFRNSLNCISASLTETALTAVAVAALQRYILHTLLSSTYISLKLTNCEYWSKHDPAKR